MRALALLSILLLAGCTQAPPEEAAAPLAEPAAPAQEAPAPAQEAPSPSPAAAEPPPAEDAPRVVVVEGSAKVTAAAGAPCVMQLRPCSRGPISPGTLEAPDEVPLAAELVVWWNATTPAGARARVEVWPAEGSSMAEGEGTSPLTIPLPPEGVIHAPLRILFEPATGSVGVDETARLVLTLLY